jgi:hypothetical protein
MNFPDYDALEPEQMLWGVNPTVGEWTPSSGTITGFADTRTVSTPGTKA